MSLEGNFRPVWVLGFPEQPKVYVQVPWLCSLRQVPEQGWSLPRDHFRHDVKIAGQIGKPAEQGRYLTKKRRQQALFGSLHLFSDIQTGHSSASHLARLAGCHAAVELRHLGRAGWKS